MDQHIVNERLRKRFAKWDVDGSGCLEQADLEEEAVQITRAFGKSSDSPEADRLNDAFTAMFESFAAEAGVSTEDSLSEDQFVSAASRLIGVGSEEAFNRVLGPLLQAIVGMCDKNADGQINREEFASWMSGIGVDHSRSVSAFTRIDQDDDGELSIEELLAAVRAFHYGDLDIELLG